MKKFKPTLILLELLFAISFGNFGAALVFSSMNYSGAIENIIIGSIIIFTFTLLGVILPRILLIKKTAEQKQFKAIDFASLGILLGIIFTLIPKFNIANSEPNNLSETFFYGFLISDPIYAPMILGVIFYNLSLYSKKSNTK